MTIASYFPSSALNFISWSPTTARSALMTAVCRSRCGLPAHDHSSPSRGRTTLGSREKLAYRGRIEIEHLRACELAVADLVEREHGAIETNAARTDPPLPPEDDHFVVAGRDDSGVHPSLRVGGLQRDPRVAPARRLRLEPA